MRIRPKSGSRRFLILGLALASLTTATFQASHGVSLARSRTTTSSIALATLNGVPVTASSLPAYQDTVTFATTIGSMAGWEYPMIALSCYQDVNGDGVVDTNLLGPDIVFADLDKPGATFSFSGLGSSSIWSLRGGGAATCRAELDAYGWKGGVESVRVMATTGDFAVAA